MPRQLLKKTALIWLLTLVTAVWGVTVVAHEHIDCIDEQCEISLLPHLGDVAPVSVTVSIPPLSSGLTPWQGYGFNPAAVTLYQSRAPPR